MVPTNLTTTSEHGKRVRSMNRSKFIESNTADNSLFMDGVKPAHHHDASFNERIDDSDRMQLGISNEIHSNSINEILRKRNNTTERTVLK